MLMHQLHAFPNLLPERDNVAFTCWLCKWAADVGSIKLDPPWTVIGSGRRSQHASTPRRLSPFHGRPLPARLHLNHIRPLLRCALPPSLRPRRLRVGRVVGEGAVTWSAEGRYRRMMHGAGRRPPRAAPCRREGELLEAATASSRAHVREWSTSTNTCKGRAAAPAPPTDASFSKIHLHRLRALRGALGFLEHPSSLCSDSGLSFDQRLHATESGGRLLPHHLRSHRGLQLHQTLQSTEIFPCLHKVNYSRSVSWEGETIGVEITPGKTGKQPGSWSLHYPQSSSPWRAVSCRPPEIASLWM